VGGWVGGLADWFSLGEVLFGWVFVVWFVCFLRQDLTMYPRLACSSQ
jgi:hypothetical protein